MEENVFQAQGKLEEQLRNAEARLQQNEAAQHHERSNRAVVASIGNPTASDFGEILMIFDDFFGANDLNYPDQCERSPHETATTSSQIDVTIAPLEASFMERVQREVSQKEQELLDEAAVEQWFWTTRNQRISKICCGCFCC